MDMPEEIVLYYLYGLNLGMIILLVGCIGSLFSAFRFSALVGILNLIIVPFPYLVMFFVKYKKIGKIPGFLILIGAAILVVVFVLGGEEVKQVYTTYYEDALAQMRGYY